MTPEETQRSFPDAVIMQVNWKGVNGRRFIEDTKLCGTIIGNAMTYTQHPTIHCTCHCEA